MRLSASEIVVAPVDKVFAEITDVSGLELHAVGRGLDVRRLDPGSEVGTGARWEVYFPFQQTRSTAIVEITGWRESAEITLDVGWEGLTGDGSISVEPINASSTRVDVVVDIRAQTLKSRVFLQSLKLARANILRRFSAKISALARQIESAGGN